MTEAPPSLVDRMLVEGLSDRVDESYAYSFALDLDLLSAADRRATVLGAIAEVLVRGWMRAGSTEDAGYVSWPGSPGAWIERIVSTWLEDWGDEIPTPGSVVWLDLTAEGRALALAAWERDPEAYRGHS